MAQNNTSKTRSQGKTIKVKPMGRPKLPATAFDKMSSVQATTPKAAMRKMSTHKARVVRGRSRALPIQQNNVRPGGD